MHTECRAFVARALDGLPVRRNVLEIGGRNINGTVRDLFPDARYIAIDTQDGPGVDVIADGASYWPDMAPDTVVCCEVLEHAPNAEQVVKNAISMLDPGGLLILTCATDPRAPHSGHDGLGVHAGEHYANIDGADLAGWLSAAGSKSFHVEKDPDRGDLYAVAWKSEPAEKIDPLRLLLVHPGADWSTADVYNGYLRALRDVGHTVGAFNLHVRLARAGEWLQWNWRKAGRPLPRPNQADAVYLAGCDVVTAALRGDVDWVIVFTGAYLHPDLFVMLRRAGRRVALVLTESPYEDEAQAKVLPYVDVAFTTERTSVPVLKRINPNVYYLPHAYDPAHHRPLNGTPEDIDVPSHDVVFVGTGFQERLDILKAVDWTGIDLGLYGTYELLGSRSKLRQHIRAEVVDNRAAAALYRRAKIGLNLYRRSMRYSRAPEMVTTAESVNPRAVELAACGVFSISDRRAEAVETFGDLVPTFDRPEELSGLIRRWLADDDGRAALSRELPARVQHSTFRSRADALGAFLRAVQTEMGERSREGVA